MGIHCDTFMACGLDHDCDPLPLRADRDPALGLLRGWMTLQDDLRRCSMALLCPCSLQLNLNWDPREDYSSSHLAVLSKRDEPPQSATFQAALLEIGEYAF